MDERIKKTSQQIYSYTGRLLDDTKEHTFLLNNQSPIVVTISMGYS